MNETFINIGTLFFASLPLFHALTGAETTFVFYKKPAYLHGKRRNVFLETQNHFFG